MTTMDALWIASPALAMTVGTSEIGWRKAWRRPKLRLMKPNAKIHAVPSTDPAARVAALDWEEAARDLDAQGCAVLKGLLTPDECRGLTALYADDAHFRSRIVMGRHGFGRGEYKYFSYPLPDLI